MAAKTYQRKGIDAVPLPKPPGSCPIKIADLFSGPHPGVRSCSIIYDNSSLIVVCMPINKWVQRLAGRSLK